MGTGLLVKNVDNLKNQTLPLITSINSRFEVYIKQWWLYQE